jgi:hypothetical protein
MHIPNRIVVIRPNDKPWMTSAVRSAIHKRNRILKQFSKKKNVYCGRNKNIKGITRQL